MAKLPQMGEHSNGPQMKAALLRYHYNGTLDTTFGSGDGIIITPLSSHCPAHTNADAYRH